MAGPHLPVDPVASIVTVSADGLTTIIAEAPPGTSAAAAAWRVSKTVQSGSDPIVYTTTWADGNAAYDNVGTASGLAALTYA
jgi:hypothetical protein